MSAASNKVLMVAYACNPEGSGEHWLGWGWAEQAAKKFSVHLITTPNARAQVEKHARPLGIVPHFVEQPQASRWGRKIGWQNRVLHFAADLHAREKFGVVHQTTFHSFRVPFRTAELGVPAVWGPIAGGESVPPGFGRDLGSVRFGEFGRRLVNRLWLMYPAVRRSLDQARTLFVSNRTTLAFLPLAAQNKSVIVPPNALRAEDEQYPPPRDQTAGSEFRLLYVGNCVATRALPLVFEAMRRLEVQGVKLTVVGSGPSLAGWRTLARKCGIGERVDFSGQVDRAQLKDFYSKADVLVFPALRDSGGSALLEAMARGVPVICLDWGGPGEMVDANSGVKISVRSRAETIAGIAAAITRLQGLPRLRTELARAAYQRARSGFTWSAKADLLNATYEKLIKT